MGSLNYLTQAGFPLYTLERYYVHCPECESSYKVDREDRFTEISCPGCGRTELFPMEDEVELKYTEEQIRQELDAFKKTLKFFRVVIRYGYNYMSAQLFVENGDCLSPVDMTEDECLAFCGEMTRKKALRRYYHEWNKVLKFMKKIAARYEMECECGIAVIEYPNGQKVYKDLQAVSV